MFWVVVVLVSHPWLLLLGARSAQNFHGNNDFGARIFVNYTYVLVFVVSVDLLNPVVR